MMDVKCWMKSENKILEMSFEFSLQIIELYKILVLQKEFIISKQLLKCATCIGANVEEANAAQTKKDFILKMSIASKEARETRYWLKLLEKSKLVIHDYSRYFITIEAIINILTKIVKTSQETILNKRIYISSRTFNIQHSTFSIKESPLC